MVNTRLISDLNDYASRIVHAEGNDFQLFSSVAQLIVKAHSAGAGKELGEIIRWHQGATGEHPLGYPSNHARGEINLMFDAVRVMMKTRDFLRVNYHPSQLAYAPDVERPANIADDPGIVMLIAGQPVKKISKEKAERSNRDTWELSRQQIVTMLRLLAEDLAGESDGRENDRTQAMSIAAWKKLFYGNHQIDSRTVKQLLKDHHDLRQAGGRTRWTLRFGTLPDHIRRKL